MLSAVYLFHFLLIIGSVGTEICITIFSVMPKKNTQNVMLNFSTTFPSGYLMNHAYWNMLLVDMYFFGYPSVAL